MANVERSCSESQRSRFSSFTVTEGFPDLSTQEKAPETSVRIALDARKLHLECRGANSPYPALRSASAKRAADAQRKRAVTPLAVT